MDNKEYNNARRLLMDSHNKSRNDLRDKHRAERNVLNEERNNLQKANQWSNLVRDEWNKKQQEMFFRHNAEDDNLQLKNNAELKEFEILNKPKQKRNAIMGAAIGALIAVMITTYQFSSSGFTESCSWDRSGTWPVEICVTSFKDSTSKDLIIFNPGALEHASIGISQKSIGGKQWESLLNAYTQKDAPTIVSFTLYPSKEEAEYSDLEQEKHGSLVVYSIDKKDYLMQTLHKLLAKYGEGREWLLMGTSRGGFNALQIQKWIVESQVRLPRKLLLVSPMLISWNPITENPPAPPIQWWKVLLAVSTQQWMLLMNMDFYAGGVDQMLTDAYKIDSAWQKADPFKWGEEVTSKFPPTLIIESSGDKFPFLASGKKLSEKWNSKYIEVEGEHATFSPVEMKEFISGN